MILKMNDPILRRFIKDSGAIRHKVKTIYLFGSRAKGTARPDSDYDILLVVTEDFTLQDKDKFYDIVLNVLLDTGRLLSLKFFKENKFRELCELGTPFMSHVLKEGILIG